MAANIPKTMNIIPTVLGVSKFVGDTNKISASVTKMARDVNRAVSGITTSSAGLSKAGVNVRSLNSAMISGLSGLNRWSAGINSINNPLTNFGKTLSTIGRSITRFSFQLERMGRGMFVAFTLPFVAAGIAVVNAASDFETALVKVENLVGVNEAVVADWGRQILETATDLAVLPVEAAKGLFAAASGFGELAGQAPVMDVLNNSIMAMNIGLGDVEDIARAVTAMMNAFADSNLDAAQATSLLVLGVREGNLEVDKLSTALGNVLGVASFIGAGADDVLAFVSAYTRFGVEPTRAVTALNTALTNLIKPSKQNREVLEAYGLTLDTVREKIAGPAGLANLLLEMEQNMSKADFLAVFGQRALKGVSAITNSVNEFNQEYLRIAENMQEETGRTFTFMAMMAEKGSKEAAEYWRMSELAGEQGMNALEAGVIRTMDTLGYKINQVKSLFQQIFIGTEAAVAPALKDYADQIVNALISVKEFIEVNRESVKLIIKIAGALALAGPALIIFSRVFQGFGVILSALGGVFTVIGTGIGIVLNLARVFAVLAINIGVRTVSALLSFGAVIYRAVAGMIALTLATAQYIALGIGLAFINIIQFAGAMGTAIAGATVSFIGFISAASPVIAAIVAIAAAATAAAAAILLVSGAILNIGGAVASAFDAVLAFFGTIADFFNELAPEGKNWGEGLMAAFSQGIYDGLIYLVEALNAVGTVIAYWLKGLSPPRIAPDIDKWGTATMQEWIDGWAKADFGVFNDIFNTIEGFLKDLGKGAGDEDDEGVITKILLGSRASIAAAMNQMRELGRVTRETLDNIYEAIGTTTAELEAYIEATLQAAYTTEKLAEAQERVNEINEKYAKILAPIQRQLEEIDRARKGVADERELAHLERVINSIDTPDRVRQLANLRVQEISLQGQQTGVEGARDAELTAAEEQVRLAEIANQAAQEQLDFASGALDLQRQGLGMMGDLIKAVEDIGKTAGGLKDKVGKIAKGVESIAGGVLDPVDFSGLGDGLSGLGDIFGDEDGEGPLSQLDAKLKELQETLEETKVIWGDVWQAMIDKYQEWVDAGTTAYSDFKAGFVDKYGPTLTALEVAGRKTWETYSTIIGDFWKDVKPDLELFVEKIKEMGGDAALAAPGAIEAIADAINGPLASALQTVLDILADTAFSSDFWTNLFAPIDRETDPLASWYDGIVAGWVDFTKDLETAWDESVDPITDSPIGRFSENFEGSKVQTDIDTFMTAAGNFIHTAWTNATEPREDYVPIRQFEGSPLQKGIDTFMSAAGELISTAWKNATSPAEESVPLFDMFKGDDADDALENLGEVTDGVYGLGTGFLTLGTDTDLAREAFALLKTKVIELKDQALATLNTKIDLVKTKIGELTTIKEEWRAKIEETVEWVQTLLDQIEGVFMTALTTLWTFISESVNPVFEELVGFLEEAYGWIKDKLDKAILGLGEAFGKLGEFLDNLIAPLKEVVSLLKEAWDKFAALPGWIIDILKGDGSVPDAPEAEGQSGGDTKSASSTQYVTGSIVGSTAAVANDAVGRMGLAASTMTAGVSTAVSGLASTIGGGVSVAPSFLPPGTAYAAKGGVAISFGDVIINNDMDMAVFEARVRRTVANSMAG